ncbi:MAG TPA: DUF2922 domain-containing protein [Clostridiales bacterium]|nr:DUF2922 domain-containing protein [Clostridia bacterium]MDD4680680.1 DUF2922 domain-containing protein [Clostridia bacterium]HCS73072.1 DUF2922 domain-containing protein [Clostridiales bacterium]
METMLEMIFLTGAGRTYKLTLNNPKEDLTPSEVQDAMNLVISKNLFDVTGGVAEIDKAQVITTQTEPIVFV